MLRYPYSEALLQRLRANDEALASLSITDIPPNGINTLEPTLSTNTVLTSLNLYGNKIGDEGAKALALNTNLTSMRLHDNKIGDEGAKTLALNTTLTSLDLGGNWIGADGAKSLALNTTLTSLNLELNEIGAEEAKALALNTNLTSLNLSHNTIGNEGAKALARNTTLTLLNLDRNEISDEGAKEFIKINTTLTRLSYYSNKLTADIEIALERNIGNNLQKKKNKEATFVQQTIVIAQGSKQRDSQLNRLPRDLLMLILDMVGKSEKFINRTNDSINYMLALTLHNMAQREIGKPLTIWQTHSSHTNKKGKQQEVHIFNLHGNFFALPKRHKNAESESLANSTQANLLSGSPSVISEGSEQASQKKPGLF